MFCSKQAMLVGASKSISGFDPRSIPGCALWLDGADASTITGTTTVTAWADKSGNSRNLSVGSGTTSYTNNAITLASSYMYVTSAVDLTNYTMFIIAKSNSSTNNQTVFVGRPNTSVDYSSTDGFGFYMDYQTSVRLYGQSSVAGQLASFSATTSNPNVFSFQPGSTVINAWLNGSSVSGGTGLSTRTSTAQGFAIGASWNGSSYNNIISTASIYEILVYNTALTQTQRQSVEGYLAWKWGLHVQVPAPVQTPLSISGCKIWFDAADSASITKSGTTVTSWSNKSGNASATTGGGTVSINQAYQNGISSVRFPAGTNYLSVGAVTFSTQYRSVFMVATLPAASTPGPSFFNSLFGDYVSGQFGAYSTTVGLGYNGYTGLLASPSGFFGTTSLVSICAGSTDQGIFINGIAQTLTTNNVTGPFWATGATTSLTLGGGSTSTTTGTLDIYEIMQYDGTVTASQRQSVENYLMGKWGIKPSLPAIHPFYSIPSFSRVFQPIDVPGCALWLDGADQTTISSVVPSTAYFPFDGSILDQSNVITFTTTGSVPYVTGKYGQAVSFVNAQGAVSSNYLSSTYNLPSTFTISCWVQLPVTSGKYMIISTAPNSGYSLGNINIYVSAGNMYCAYDHIANNGAGYAVSANTWYHAAITYNSGTLLLYVNGAQSGSAVTAAGSTINGITIGGGADLGPDPYPVTGYVDDLRIYNSVLTAAQISNIYVNTLTTNVSQWSDKSGSRNNFTPSAGTVTTSTDSGYPVLNFPSGAIMSSANQITFTPASAFYTVFRQSTLSGQGLDYVIGFTNATVGQTGDQGIRIGGSGLYGAGTLTGGAQDVGNNNYYVNGFFNPTFPLSTFSNTFVMVGTTVCSSTTTSYITISTAFSSRFFIGSMCELLYYPGGLTTTQRQQVEGYLAAKWGLLNNLPGKTLSPLNISGCVLWLDAADTSTLMLSTNNVTQWSDKSGSGNNATQATAGSQPTTGGIQNGLNTLLFTGKVMTYPTISLSAQTVFCVYLNNTFTPYGWPVHIGPFAFFYAAPSSNVGIGRSGYTDEVLANWSTNGLTTSKYTVYGGTVSVSGTTTSVLYFNGNQVASNTVTSSGGLVNYTIGTLQSGANTVTGYIAEVIVFNSVLGTTQRQSVENYLMSKWGISNVTTHPFKSIPPSTSQPPQFQEVTPGNWKYDWQPYLSNLTRANNSANSTVIPTVAYGTGGASLSPALSIQYYFGGVLAPNGTIYCIPNGSSNILMINTATNGVSYGTGGPSLSPALSTQSYIGGVLAPNGTIYCAPWGAANILMINTSSNSVSYGTGGASLSPALSTQSYFGGGVLGPNGNIYCPPNLSSNILIINTSDNSVKYGTGGASLSPALSTQSYSGGVLAPNGTIYCAPYGASNILMINTSSNSVSYGTGGASLSPALSTQSYSGAILAPNGNIYCIPKAAANVLIINTSTNSVSYGTNSLGTPALSGQGYYGGVLAPNGTIYCVPGGASNILRISNTYTETPSSNYCLSPWTNKL